VAPCIPIHGVRTYESKPEEQRYDWRNHYGGLEVSARKKRSAIVWCRVHSLDFIFLGVLQVIVLGRLTVFFHKTYHPIGINKTFVFEDRDHDTRSVAAPFKFTATSRDVHAFTLCSGNWYARIDIYSLLCCTCIHGYCTRQSLANE
jgi:hypothetical protein